VIGAFLDEDRWPRKHDSMPRCSAGDPPCPISPCRSRRACSGSALTLSPAISVAPDNPGARY
jgi:hypothetical protein